jgi:hypothetical protein
MRSLAHGGGRGRGGRGRGAGRGRHTAQGGRHGPRPPAAGAGDGAGQAAVAAGADVAFAHPDQVGARQAAVPADGTPGAMPKVANGATNVTDMVEGDDPAGNQSPPADEVRIVQPANGEAQLPDAAARPKPELPATSPACPKARKAEPACVTSSVDAATTSAAESDKAQVANISEGATGQAAHGAAQTTPPSCVTDHHDSGPVPASAPAPVQAGQLTGSKRSAPDASTDRQTPARQRPAQQSWAPVQPPQGLLHRLVARDVRKDRSLLLQSFRHAFKAAARGSASPVLGHACATRPICLECGKSAPPSV